ncbi:MAG: citrate synthase [Verrucomicrobia bacterium]|nr:MAG: citrate synthase [Verrucomicrobiota bacterium]
MNAETKQSYSPGLEGIIAGETSISRVDPDAGLMYRGYDIAELAVRASYEEVVWLLLHGELPGMSDLGALTRQLSHERAVPAAVIEMLELLPPETSPIDSLRTGVSMLAAFDPEINETSAEAMLRKASRLIARTNSLITAGWRIALGQEAVPQQSNLTHAGHFLQQLFGAVPEVWRVEAMDTILVLYADHDFNASTFSARVTASTLSDIYAAITTALGTLKGPLHGGANEQAMKMLREIGEPERAKSWVEGRLGKKEKVMGFGHRVYKKGDARVPVMRALVRQLGERAGEPQWAGICEKLEEIMEREKHLAANVDLYAAPALHLLGIPSELNTPVFACGRVAGWCAHVLEQQAHNRLIRPRSLYIGPARRAYRVKAQKSAA